jgi:SAM-dependent methyltransferase
VLDVGCGTGQFLAAALERGWKAVGTELSRAPLTDAAGRAGRAALLVGEITALRDEPLFDAVTFWDVLEHVPHPLRLLDAARRRLRPRGVVAATLPNADGVTAWLHGGRWKYYDFAEFGHIYHLSLRGLRELFRRGGLHVEVARTLGSTDLRHVREARGGAPHGRAANGVLDRASGLLARAAEPLGLGNTLLVVGRRP